MYLAEDRILCLEIVAKKGCQYRLEFIKEAVAEADPVTKLVGLMKQRKSIKVPAMGIQFPLIFGFGSKNYL